MVAALAEFMGKKSVSAFLFNRLALIGMGLIGSSIARAARAQGVVKTIVATARSPQTRQRVQELGIADEVVDDNAAAVKDADLVIVCIPVGQSGAVAKEIGAQLKPGAVVSDVGSVKGAVLRDMARICQRACISFPAIRWREPNIPAPTQASPSSSSTAGAS